MASIKYNLKNPKATDETPIYLRYNDKGINVKFYISQKIHPKKWHSESEQARKIYQGYSDFNTILDGHKSHLKTLCGMDET